MLSFKYVIRHTRARSKKPVLFNLAIPFISKAFISSSPKTMETLADLKKKPMTYTEQIIKSSEDKRLYQGLELNNGMKVLLISDPDCDKSAAALNVNVGSMSEPDYLPGLAHFCEHMLFLGTEKYPLENAYNKYLSEHGGGSNAATSFDHTMYYFYVVPEHFEGALDRFAQFFLKPLFTESATDREVNAVHSEHEKNIASDVWRLSQLEKHTAKKDHPYNKFGSGNHQTLVITPKEKNINLRDELLKFHQKWYSSNIMTLAVLGRETLNELEAMVVSLFSEVENKNANNPEWLDHPYGPEEVKVRGYVVPVKDLRNLNISFPIPDFHKHYKSKPFSYVSNLVGHEGPGSLLSALKTRGWCNGLIAGSRNGAKGFGFFYVTVDLTEEGIDHVDDIATLVFQYINMMNKEGPKKWFHEECKQLAEAAYRFKDKEAPHSYVTKLTQSMHDFPLEEVLVGPYMLKEWRPDLIEEACSYLKPTNVRIAVTGKNFESIADETEPWYGTRYKLEKIPETTIKNWEECGLCPELALPPPNEFITSNFKIYPCEEEKTGTPQPSVVHHSSFTRVWFRQDDEFLLPKANVTFEFVSPLAYLDPLNCNLTHMYVNLLKDSLTEYDYSADLAGLRWEIVNSKYGMVFGISGYNDKQGVLLDKILERMTNLKIDPKRFEILKEDYVRSLKNFEAEIPYQQAVYYLASLVSEQAWTKEELLENFDDLTVKRLDEFIPQLLSKLHVEGLIHGNLDKDRAAELIKILEDKLTLGTSLRRLLPRELLRDRQIQLLDGSHYLFETVNYYHRSSCTETYYQCGLQSTKTNILSELLAELLKEPCFDILRTKEQLGYCVMSGLMRSHGVQGLRIIVQSDRHPSYVDSRIEAFLVQAREIIDTMTPEVFERYREALAAQRLEKPKNLSTLSARFWAEITSQQYHFNRTEVEVAYLRTITKKDVLDFFDEFIKHNGAQRRKLSVHVLSKAEGGAGSLPADLQSYDVEDGLAKPPPSELPKKIEDVTKFKSSHGLYPLVQPYMNISQKNTKSKL